MLDQLLTGLSLDTFRQEYLFRLPFACAGGCIQFAHVATLETVQDLLQAPEADVVITKDGHWTNVLPMPLSSFSEALTNGYTVGVRHAHLHDTVLKKLANEFGQEFLAPVDIHVYCTPRGTCGFGWHYDAEDVFILQTVGSKEWSLRKNTVNPWPIMESLPEDMHYEREIMPLQKCLLSQGDWLYIPNGYWHRTLAVEESVSLSVGICSATCLEVLDFFRDKLQESLEWRARLPVVGDTPATTEALLPYQELLSHLGHDLCRRLDQPRTAVEFLDWRRHRNFPMELNRS